MSLYSNESEPQALSFDQPTGAAFLALISDQVTRLGTVTVLTLPVIFFLLAITNCFSLKNKDGNKIPSGPLGLPILGTFTARNIDHQFDSNSF